MVTMFYQQRRFLRRRIGYSDLIGEEQHVMEQPMLLPKFFMAQHYVHIGITLGLPLWSSTMT